MQIKAVSESSVGDGLATKGINGINGKVLGVICIDNDIDLEADGNIG